MSAPVFLCSDAADARVGDVLTVTGGEACHAVTVQRRGVGEHVDLIDGLGNRASGAIVEASGVLMRVSIDAVSRDADPVTVLVQALAKGGRDEQGVEAAIELGATRIVPWAAQRSIVQWRGPKADKARHKWESLVLTAAKQSRRAFVAPVDPLATTAALACAVTDAVAAGERVLLLHEDAAQSIAALTWEDARQPVWVIVGPEGGIGETEVDQLRAAGAEAVVLGPHVLRASSAGPAALAALAVTRGAWATPMARLTGPPVGAYASHMSDDCLFCSIIAGDIPAQKVIETDRVVAFRDIAPKAPVHVLVVPRTHVATVADAAREVPAELAEMAQVAQRIADDECGGQFRWIFNTGEKGRAERSMRTVT